MEPIKEIALERTYEASHETVWQAWTNPEMLKQPYTKPDLGLEWLSKVCKLVLLSN